MQQSLKIFLKGIVDYAGLFPPAALELDPALRNYARYREGEDAWMLSRFVIPSGRMEELLPYAGDLFASGPPLSLSVLGGAAETVDEFENRVAGLEEELRRFHREYGGKAATEVLEVKLPREAVLANDAGELKRLADGVARRLDGSDELPVFVFYEAAIEESWRRDLPPIMEALKRHNSGSDHETYRYAGFKLRCGGTEAAMVPTPEQVAFALNRAREHSLAVKCTAGLHHPLRRYSESLGTRTHGFINVFGGAMIAWAHDLDDEELEAVLKEEDPGEFRFGGEAFGWRDYNIFTGEIAELREVALVSFGSCSFDEPREDLRGMGLLEE